MKAGLEAATADNHVTNLQTNHVADHVTDLVLNQVNPRKKNGTGPWRAGNGKIQNIRQNENGEGGRKWMTTVQWYV